MNKSRLYPVSEAFSKDVFLNEHEYQDLYQYSISNPLAFWDEQGKKFITWFTPWDQVMQGSFKSADISWYKGGKLNASYNCLDRHLAERKDAVAIIFEGDKPNDMLEITYEALHALVCKFSNVLKNHGVKKGDRVCIYLPMIPEMVVAMLACARIGAIHSVVFAGFSAEALKMRIQDAKATLLITADQGLRGGKIIPLKENADLALTACPEVHSLLVVKRTGSSIDWNPERDTWYHEAMLHADTICEPEIMDSDDPLFILYTSGSTGKPKGILHSTGGYLVYAAITHHYVFDYKMGEIFWCTADAGWITGHSYVVYGPLLNGATTVIYEGTPGYPDFSRYWQMIDRHQVNIFYTSPTGIRALRHEGDTWVNKSQRTSLRLLGTVGEPINPDVWEWYYTVVGKNVCPIVDTWWQTETGGALITPLPGATALKPGAAAKPFLGIEPAIVDEQGNVVKNNTFGNLVIKQPWPGLMKSIYGDKPRFVESYLQKIPGCYYTGDGAYQDEDGYYWITGRNDDVIKVSGHRISTAELESAFLSHPAVSEAAVVPVSHAIKGQAIYAFVTLAKEKQPSEDLRFALIQHIRSCIGALATPEYIQWTLDLPKTRSGKIMRRILRGIAENTSQKSGDISTLANPGVIEQLIEGRKRMFSYGNKFDSAQKT